MKHILFSGAAALLLAGCMAAPGGPVGSPGDPNCPIIAATGWTAWIDAMPGPTSRPTLITTGKVIVPSGGYRFAWRDLRVMESYPVQVVAELQVIPPAGPASQATVTHDINGQWAVSPPVGSFTVRCGNRVLARIDSVDTAY